MGFLLVALIGRWDRGNPLVWTREQLARGFTVVGERMEPEVSIAVTPAAEVAAAAVAAAEVAAAEGEAPAGAAPVVAVAGAVPPAKTLEALPPPTLPNAQPAVADSIPVDTPEPPPPTEQPATATPVPTATPLPSETPLPTATPVGPATPGITPGPTAVAYIVRRGDTLVTIASRYDIEVEDLMAANDISAREVYVIQPGQILMIPTTPPSTVLPSPTAVAAAAGTQEAPPTLLVTPTPMLGAFRVAAPVLRRPRDAATIDCSIQGKLEWERVAFVKDSDKYLLHLGFVSGRSDGGEEQVTWILAQPRPVTETVWALDESLCGLAPQQYDRQWRWWVEVVAEIAGKQTPVSPPSAIWGFTWD